MSESNAPLDHFLKGLLTILSVGVLVFIVIVLVSAVSTSVARSIVTVERSAETMGDKLTFPPGWIPAFCEARGVAGCKWVCQSRIDSSYRYCTPTISTVEAPQARGE